MSMILNNGELSFGQLVSSMQIYDNSLCSLQFDQNQPKSAVAIIIKTEQKGQAKNTKVQHFFHDQILLLQRKVSPKDRFSGQICFPGGRQEPNQTLLNTVIRQTFQQTNILLTQQNLIGCIDRQVNFIISAKKQPQKIDQKPPRQMHVYSFVFLLQTHFISTQNIKLNHQEMETFQWIKTKQLTNPKNLCFLDYTQKISSLAKVYEQYPNVKNNKISALSCVNRVLSPAFNVNMNKQLYGITFYIFLILITNLTHKLESIIVGQSLPEDRIDDLKQVYCNLKEIKTKSEAHVIFQLKKPISEQFRSFQAALLQGLYKMRPKL